MKNSQRRKKKALDEKEILRRIDLFAELTDAEAESVLSLMREQRLARDKIIFRQHDVSGGLFLILEGSVKISRIARDGREVIIAILNDGNFFGEMSLLDGQPRSGTATATSACRFLVLERDNFLKGIMPMTGIVAKMLLELSRRLRAADQNIENLALGTVFDRLFHYLSHLGRRFPLKGCRSVITKRPTHQELAELVGSSRETVTRTLAFMEKQGYIEIRKKEIVLLPAFFEEEKARF